MFAALSSDGGSASPTSTRSAPKAKHSNLTPSLPELLHHSSSAAPVSTADDIIARARTSSPAVTPSAPVRTMNPADIMGFSQYGDPLIRPGSDTAKWIANVPATPERAERQGAIGAGNDAPEVEHDVHRMTPERYASLDPKQRAAVDFNTMLVKAVRKDLHNQEAYKPDATQRDTYNLGVTKMFGEQGGSDTYAPETVAVLRQIGYHDDSADLDDFLGLNAAITAHDIKRMGAIASDTSDAPKSLESEPSWDILNQVRASESSAAVPNTDGPELDRYNLAESLANSTAVMEQKLASTQQLLQSFTQTAAMERNDDLSFMGGVPNQVKPLLGYGQGEVDQYFQQAFDVLGNKANTKDRDQILATINQDLSPQEFQSFLTYVDNRTTQADQYGIPLGADEKVTYRSPEDFRKLLGLDDEE